MSIPSLGPYRRKILETYVACLRRAERRIVFAGRLANGRAMDLERYPRQAPLIQHAAQCIKERGVMGHGSALMKLQIARSRLAAELQNLPW